MDNVKGGGRLVDGELFFCNSDVNILEEFDLLVEPYNKYPVVKRICPSCAATHTESQTNWQVIGWSGLGAWNGDSPFLVKFQVKILGPRFDPLNSTPPCGFLWFPPMTEEIVYRRYTALSGFSPYESLLGCTTISCRLLIVVVKQWWKVMLKRLELYGIIMI